MEKKLLILVAAALQFPLAGMAVAQESEPAIEEILVTAQKREESAADLGMAIDVVDGELIRESGAVSLIDLGRFSPGLNIQTPFGEFGYPLVAIRGLSTDGFIETLPQSTGVYADGVYVSQPPMQAFRLLDIERMEVLKGPQGTIYGRNTIAGAVNIISKRPTFEPEGYVSAGGGSYGRRAVEAAYGGALSDTAAGRVAMKYLRQTDSPLTNTFPGADDGGEIDQLMGRAALLFQPGDDIEVLLRGHFGRDDSDVWPFSLIPAGEDTTGDGLPDRVCDAFARGDVNAAKRDCLAADPFVSGASFNDPSGDAYTNNQNAIGAHAYRSTGLSAELNRDLGAATFTSITGWDDFERHDQLDEDGGPTVALDNARRSDVRQLSQEFRIASNGGENPRWLAGFYYSTDDLRGSPSFDSGGRQDYSTLETDTRALFGQFAFALRDDLELTAGARLTDVERAFFYRTTGIFAAAELRSGSAREFSDSDYSLRLALDWRATDDTLIYGSISRGFNAGTFNSQFLATPENMEPTASESLIAYEAGVKTFMAGGRASFEGSVYFYDAKNPQVVAVAPLSGISANFLINADDSSLMGAEAQLRALPTDWLELSLGAAYITSEYGNLVTAVAGAGAGSPYPDNAPIFGSTLADLTGNRIPNHPELSFNSMIRVTRPVGDGWRFDGRLDYLWEDDIPRDLLARRALFTESHIDANLRLALRSTDGNWDIAFRVRNLTGEEYLTEAYEVLGFGFFIAAGTYNYPRTFAFDITRNF